MKWVKKTDRLIIEVFKNSSLVGKNTSTLVPIQTIKPQTMAKVLVE